MTLRELREVRVLRRMPVPVESFLSEFSATYGDLFLHAAVFTNTLGKSSSRSSTAALMTAWPSWVTRQRRERGAPGVVVRVYGTERQIISAPERRGGWTHARKQVIPALAIVRVQVNAP